MTGIYFFIFASCEPLKGQLDECRKMKLHFFSFEKFDFHLRDSCNQNSKLCHMKCKIAHLILES